MTFYARLVDQTKNEKQNLLMNPLIEKCFKGEITKNDYILFLMQAYHHVKNTVPLLMLCGSKLSEPHRDLQAPIAHYIEEEIGHEQWILSDLEKCGITRDLVVDKLPLTSTDVFVSFIYDIIQRKNPLGFFGMVYVLESTSVLIASKAADTILTTLNLPKSAFSYLYSHGELDKSHMQFFEKTISLIKNNSDQDFIIHCTKQLFKLYGDILIEINQHSQNSTLGTLENVA